MRIVSKQIDTTRNADHRLGLLSSTLFTAASEDTVFLKKILITFREQFVKNYPSALNVAEQCSIAVLNLSRDKLEEARTGMEAARNLPETKNKEIKSYVDYFLMQIITPAHDEIEHPHVDSIFLDGINDCNKTRLKMLSLLMYVSRASYMSTHDNKQDYFGHENEKFNCFDTAILIGENINNRLLLLRLRASQARVYSYDGNDKKAQTIALGFIEEGEQLKDTASLSIGYYVIGTAFIHIENFKDAEKYALKNLELAKGAKDNGRLCSACGRLMEIYHALGDTTKALEYGRMSISYNNKAGNHYNAGLVYGNFGEVLFGLGYSDSAHYYQNLALSIREETKNLEGMLYSYNSLAEIALADKKFAEAVSFTDKAWEIEQRKHFRIYNPTIFMHWYKAHEGLGDWKSAFANLQKYITVQDSLDSLNNATEINKLQSEYDEQILKKDYAHDKEKLQNENAKRQQEADRIRNALLIGVGILLIITALILRSWYIKKKANGLLEIKNAEIEKQKALVDVKQKEILDSINYAKRLQEAILPSVEIVKKHLEDFFILYLPKDIVAGDFYFFETSGDKIFFAAADCTGHGVPGAMVSVVCSNALSRAVNEFDLETPALVLDKVNALVQETFSKSENEVRDGMDISMLMLSKDQSGKITSMQWSGAHNPLVIVRNGNLLETKADNQPVGYFENRTPFTNHIIDIEEGDMIFLYTDGYADQFGGEKGKKFKSSSFKKLLQEIAGAKSEEQKRKIEETHIHWKGNIEQVDDICVLGIRI